MKTEVRFFSYLYLLLAIYIYAFLSFVLPLIPSISAGHGLMSGDNVLFHQLATAMAEEISKNGIGGWKLYPHVSAGINVGIASIFYLIKPSVFVLIPWNALLHTFSAYLLFKILTEFNFDRKIALLSVTLLSFFPTTLLWTSQLHKDLYAIPAWLLYFYSVLLIFNDRFKARDFLFVLLALFLFFITRPLYLNMLLVVNGFAFLAFIFCGNAMRLKIYKIALIEGVIFISMMNLGFSNLQDDNVNKVENVTLAKDTRFTGDCASYEWSGEKFLPKFFESKLYAFASVRNRQICYSFTGTNSNVDEAFLPKNLKDFIFYIPRALEIALFFPTIPMLVKISNIKSSLVLIEMMIYYLSLAGVFWAIIKSKNRSLLFLVSVVVFSSLFLSLISPNMGTFHRVRFPFFSILTVLGLSLNLSVFAPLLKRLQIASR